MGQKGSSLRTFLYGVQHGVLNGVQQGSRVYTPVKFDRPIVEILVEKHSIAKAVQNKEISDEENRTYDKIITRMVHVAEQGKHHYVFGLRYYELLKILDHEESRVRLLDRLRREKLITEIIEEQRGLTLKVAFIPKDHSQYVVLPVDNDVVDSTNSQKR